jgi:tetratricopeptide (TPR) repeat protein
MSTPAKITLYIVLTAASVFFGIYFIKDYDRLMAQKVPAVEETTDLEQVDLSRAEEGKKLPGESTMTGFGFGFFVSVVILGLLTAHDVSAYFGGKASKAVYSGGDEPTASSEYENAEEVWAKGNFIEAIELFRAYHKKHPKEVHVALRITEIYEKDLKNLLAAALEYEDILKQPLPRKRWGWAAIHLCNLYFKLNNTDQATALLNRIVEDYGDTPAAEKARKRLALLAGEEYVEPTDSDEESGEENQNAQ